MGISYLSISVFCTALSYVGLQCWMGISVQKLKSDGFIGEGIINFGNESRALETLLGSQTTIALGANFAVNIFTLLVLCLKTIFFGDLHSPEIRKVVELLVNYVISKGTFLPLVVPPTLYQACLWSTWLVVLCFLKMFQALARDRLERLNASPSATPWTYFRVYSALLLVFSANLLWMRGCLVVYRTRSSSLFLLLFFEPLSIAFETLQAILVHGFQLLDMYIHDSANDISNSRISKLFDISAAGVMYLGLFMSSPISSLLSHSCKPPTGSFGEWKGILIRNMGFLLDMMTLLMALAHYVHIWWLHGMAFHLVDAVLFLNIRALLSAIVKRVKGCIKLRIALGTLHGALPDATLEELQTYDDECAICREPMAKAKKLSCNHLFHLSCLRSWLDQGLTENYSCPTCRKPLFIGRSENEVNPHTADVQGDELLAREMSMGLDRLNLPGHALPNEVSRNQTHNPLESSDWRGSGIDSGWLGLDDAGPSTGIRSGGLGRVQTVMRHLAAVGETYAQAALEDAAWNLWSMRASQAGTSNSAIPPTGNVRHVGGSGGLHLRTPSRATNNNVSNIYTMVETVREVLPHIPDEIILEDLQRTHSVTVTVNNLLHM